jgi:hypothetical protein
MRRRPILPRNAISRLEEGRTMQNSALHSIHLRKRSALLIVGSAVRCRILGALPAARPSRIVKSKVVTP